MPSTQWTPLFSAVIQGGRIDLVKLLLEHGAQVNITDAYHRTPLYYAIARQRNDIADLLLKAGAKPLAHPPDPLPESFGYYSSQGRLLADKQVMEMDEAIMHHDKAKVEALLKSGADANKRNPSRNTPLLAAMKCDVEIVRLLLDNGADPNMGAKSSDQTPIFHAAYYGRDDLISELLRHGAKVNLGDAMGKSPLWYAQTEKKEATVKALKAAGATE
jgi:ankyrin repeat protein